MPGAKRQRAVRWRTSLRASSPTSISSARLSPVDPHHHRRLAAQEHPPARKVGQQITFEKEVEVAAKPASEVRRGTSFSNATTAVSLAPRFPAQIASAASVGTASPPATDAIANSARRVALLMTRCAIARGRWPARQRDALWPIKLSRPSLSTHGVMHTSMALRVSASRAPSVTSLGQR